MPDQETKTETGAMPGIGSSELLADWTLAVRNWGQGTCCGCHGTVLTYGKWGVIGRTGYYRIIFPSGWEEDHPTFKTELEAMLWVMQQRKTKPKPVQTAAGASVPVRRASTEKTRSSDSTRVRARGAHSSTTDTTAKDSTTTGSESMNGAGDAGNTGPNAPATLRPTRASAESANDQALP